MNPRAVFLLILAAAAVVVVAVWLIARQAGVRRRDHKRIVTERNLLAKAIADINTAADLYRDIDSVLATSVRSTIRTLEANRLELDQ